MRDVRHLDLRARPGVVEVELPESPTTGFLWRLVNPPPGVNEIGREFRAEQDEPVAGGSGVRVFRIEVPEPGQYELQFQLRRPWEDQPRERAVAVLDITAPDV